MSTVIEPRIWKDCEIEELAVKTLKDAGRYCVPVDVLNLAEELGLDVYSAKFSNQSVSGMIRKESGRIVIYYNENHHSNRARFTVAHEIGHYVLKHMKYCKSISDSQLDMFRRDDDYVDKQNYRFEVEANKFAAALLMPSEFVVETWNETDGDVEEIARKFRVSEAAMGYRIDRLDTRILS